MFENGLQYVRADFHLHTYKDKEFVYSGKQNSFVSDYVSALKNLISILASLQIITNLIKTSIMLFVRQPKSKTYLFYQE